MTRPLPSTVVRRFLDGETCDEIAYSCGEDRAAALDYVEQCIRRELDRLAKRKKARKR